MKKRCCQHFVNRRYEPDPDLIFHIVGRHLYVSLIFLGHDYFAAPCVDGCLELGQDTSDGKYFTHNCNLARHGEIVADRSAGKS
jgi:hypothetical protein